MVESTCGGVGLREPGVQTLPGRQPVYISYNHNTSAGLILPENRPFTTSQMHTWDTWEFS